MTVLTGQQNQILESRRRLTDEGTSLTREKEKLKERVATLQTDVYEFETELAGLEAKLTGYAAELSSPLTAGLTGEEERLIDMLGKEVEKRRKEMVELSKNKNQVSHSSFFNFFSVSHDVSVGKPQECSRN
jgi:structural maintenance of chromosome 3 (chondroitin sulfate proteoglycan 6)